MSKEPTIEQDFKTVLAAIENRYMPSCGYPGCAHHVHEEPVAVLSRIEARLEGLIADHSIISAERDALRAALEESLRPLVAGSTNKDWEARQARAHQVLKGRILE